MNEHLSRSYEYYDARGADKWQTLQKGNTITRARKLAQYISHLSHYQDPSLGEFVQPSKQEILAVEDAKKFIEDMLGIEVDCGVAEVSSFNKTYAAGAYDSSLHYLFFSKYSSDSAYDQAITMGSLLVHEIVHSTSAKTAKVIDIDDGVTRNIHTVQPHHITDINQGTSDDHFFEEGLAEEIASRWRQKFDPKIANRERELKSSFGHSPIPIRMFTPGMPIDEIGDNYQPGFSQPAICAFGIQLLSEYTGVDIIDLLIKARKPETQVSASTLLKDTVDSIEPGLYDVLTSARYSPEDFEDCLSIIKDAIANHAHSQIK